MNRLVIALALAVTVGGCHTSTTTPAAAKGTPTMPASEATTTLKVGSTAPAFALEAGDGSTVSLADTLVNGPAVVVFYRGNW
jgi:cytochrome oxidase Cu insertion factor (SCO1/SenC/PrrC family)